MKRGAHDSMLAEAKCGDLALLSRRGFLSSVAATGTAVIWPAILAVPDVFPQESVPTQPALPPPAGQEASYEWYARQYTDPSIFTTIGLPADPAETAVSPKGELLYANDLVVDDVDSMDRHIQGTGYARNSLAFAFYVDGKVVPIGTEQDARQSLEKGYFPIVVTRWKYRDLEIRETAFSQPLNGEDYRSGLESTLAWAVLEVTNHSGSACPVTLLSIAMGNEKNLKPDLTYSDGAVMQKGRALFSVQLPSGFTAQFHPVFPPSVQATAEADPLGFLRGHTGVFNALAVEGRIEAGKTARAVFNRRLDFPGADYWGPGARVAILPEELTSKSADKGLEFARATWGALSRQVARFQTPDQNLNNIVNKAMLDGYFLTKRWNGNYIEFDSVCYPCQYDDASAKWIYALDLMGDHTTSERLLDTIFSRQGKRKPAGTRTREGCFSDVTNIKGDGSEASWASCNGWALWAMAEHARLTHDSAWIDRHKQQILDGCDWIHRERQFSKETQDNPCAGLLYGKFVCDMADNGAVKGIGYFTYTDAINYMGLHQMGGILASLGHPEAEPLLREAENYRNDIVAAVDRLTDKSQDPWYIPWMLSAPHYVQRYFYDVCGPINLAYGRVLPRDDVRIQHVIRWIIDRTHHGSLEEATAGIKKAEEGAMFYSQDLAIVLLELGRVEDFLRILYTLLAANVSHQTFTTCEWRNNTQPHIHSISSLIRMVRTMLIQERDEGLYLLQGIPRRWMEQGKTLSITETPTWYGTLSLEVTSDIASRQVRAQLGVPERIGSTPVHLRLRLPDGRRIDKVQINGREHLDLKGDSISLKGFTGKADIVAFIS